MDNACKKKYEKSKKRDFVPSFLMNVVRKILLTPFFFLILIFLPLSGMVGVGQCLLLSGAAIVPDHIVLADLTGQVWSSTWMAAREGVRKKRKEEALVLYKELLSMRPGLVEARWEFAKLLLAMERYRDAEENLEKLLEMNPDNLAYQRAQGTLLLATGRPARAVISLAKVWSGDDKNFEVGMQLYQAYVTLGDKKKALPVLEELHRKKPDDLVLKRSLFLLYVDLGKDQQAQPLGASLANSKDATFDLILQVAKVHDRLALTHLAAEYRLKIILLRPDYSPAHAYLAAYYSKQGREAEALPHLLHGYGKDQENSKLAGRIGVIYARQNKFEQAIPFLEQYLRAYPNDADKNLVLAQSYKATGYLDKSSRLFTKYLGLVEHPSAAIRLQAAQVYTDTGDKKKAVDQYQYLVADGDGDGDGGKHLVDLAKNLSATGRYNEALTRWKQFSSAHPEDLESRLEMVSLLEKLGRRDEMVVMLQQIHELDANNYLVTLRLSEHYFLQGQTRKAWQLFTPLLDMEFFSPDFLTIRARIFHFLGLPGRAFRDMAEVVAKENVADGDRLAFLDIAGVLGRRDVVMEQAAGLDDKSLFRMPAGRLIYARALGRGGEIAQAEKVYAGLFAEGDAAIQAKAHLDLAEIYQLYGFYDEAEEQYRLAWLAGHDQQVLTQLVDLNLFLGQVYEAEEWLDAISADSEGNSCQRSLAELRVLNGQEEFSDVLSLGAHLLSFSDGNICSPKQRDEMKLQMARAHFGEGDDDLSVPLLSSIVGGQKRDFAAHATLFRIHKAMGNDDLAKKTIGQALDVAGYDAGLLSALMEEALEKRLYPLASAAGRKLCDIAPQSFGYQLRFVRVLGLNGELDEAASLTSKLLVAHGGNGLLNLYGARVALSLGHYEKGLKMAEEALSQKADWYAALLIKARLHWALFQWPEAISVYTRATTPSAQEMFLGQCAEKDIVLSADEEIPVWLKMIQPLGRPESLSRSLAVDFVKGEKNSDVAWEAARFYADYKWQMIIKRELAARKSVQRREYYHAVKLYKSLLQEQDEPTLLFDLAGVYSSLDRVGDEALVYQRLQQYNPDFPGLNEAIGRNHLKRQPQTGGYFSSSMKKGKAGYFDINQNEYGVSGWLSPNPQKEIKVSASRIHYESPTSVDGFYAKRVDISLASIFFDYLHFQASAGGHTLDDDSNRVGVYALSATGLAGDWFESYIGVKRQIVADTLASVNRGLMAQIYEARAEVDLMPWLQAVAEGRRTEYSDDNAMHGYSVCLSSVLVPEPHFLKASFLYEFMDAQGGEEASGVLLSDGFAVDDHPYWAPEHYTRNHFNVNYKHKFSDDVLGRSTPSYFTAGYGFSYDVNGDACQYFRAGFNMEISNSWILKVEAEFEESDTYQRRDLFGTILCRW